MDLIRRNFGLKAGALLIAVGLWFTFNYLTASQSYSTTLQVPLVVRGVSPNLVATTAVKDVSVELSGPRSAVEKLVPDDFAAYVDCSGKDPGVQSLSVAVQGPEGDKITSISPASAIVALDRFGYRRVPVISSDSAQSAMATSVEPTSVVISGPEAVLARVMGARVNIEGASTTTPVTITVKPVAVDAAFGAVAGVTIAPPTVRVAIAPRKG